MKILRKTPDYLEHLRRLSYYKEGLELARLNSSGNIYLVGSTVYGEINWKINHQSYPTTDLDFLVDTLNDTLIVPAEFEVDSNEYLGWALEQRQLPRFKRGVHVQVDLIVCKDTYAIARHKWKPTLTNYFRGVPLNIQAIAMDTGTGKIHGDTALEAINRKELRINNMNSARFSARAHGQTLEEFLNAKSEKLGFSYKLPKITMAPHVPQRCTLCHDTFTDADALSELELGQYIHADCQELTTDHTTPLPLRYRQIAELAREHNGTTIEFYEAIRKKRSLFDKLRDWF